MAERNQVTSDFDSGVQDRGIGIKAANGGSPLPPLIAPEMNDAPLAPANDGAGAPAIASNGDAGQVAPATQTRSTSRSRSMRPSKGRSRLRVPKSRMARPRLRARLSMRASTTCASPT